MRGFPLLNLILCLLLSGAVLLPMVYRSTREPGMVAHVPVPDAGPVLATPVVPARVMLRFVHAPVQVRLFAGETPLHEWKPAKPDTELEAEVNLPLSEGRSEFTVKIEWPAGTPNTMAELRVEPDGLATRTANIWGEGSADEVVALTWKDPRP